ncbi:MAG TPA: hypothetical protein VEB20_19085 [Azospirillaceae bacterium]|nr:hypothetical protein [Azospirillaceae bacterium]
MSLRFLLPPGQLARRPTRPGAWEFFADFGVLGDIAKGLHAKSDLGEAAADVVSVPDVWAQATNFEAALDQRSHPLHVRSVGEWRALIAMFALRDYRELAVSCSVLELGAGEARRHDGSGGDHEPFESVLARLKPDTALMADMSWNRLGLVQFGRHPIALFVPTTLVCPVRDYSRSLDDMFPFQHRGRLVDPLTRPTTTPEEAKLIAAFCESLKSALITFRDDRDRIVSKPLMSNVVQLLNDYVQDCSRMEAAAAVEVLPERPMPLDVPHELFGAFGRAATVRVAERFDALLRPRVPFAGLFKGAVLLDDNLVASTGRPAAEIRIWGRHTLAEFQRTPAETEARIRKEAAEAGYMVLRPLKDLFSPQLCRFGDGTLVRQHPAGGQAMLLPVSPLLCLFLEPEEIRRAVTVETGTGMVRVSLRLSVATSAGEVRTLEYRATYRDEDRNLVMVETANRLGMWPDFRHPDWTWHFLFHSGTVGQGFDLDGCISPRLVTAAMAGERGPGALQQLPALLAKARDEAREEVTDARGKVVQGILSLSEPPEALFASVEGRPAGLMLLPTPEEAPRREADFRLGVDFGTTNSIVYCRDGAQPPQLLVFRNRTLSPYDVPASSPRAPFDFRFMLTEFIPAAEVVPPFLSLLRRRGGLSEELEERPVWSDLVYYIRNLDDQVGLVLGQKSHNLRFDLKWGGHRAPIQETQRRRRSVTLFLEQICLQALAESAARGISPSDVKWRFSYPGAFTSGEKDEFTDHLLPKVVSTVLRQPREAAAQALEPALEEGLAAAYYFARHQSGGVKSYFNQTVLSLDVGGGTTDVSLWQDSRLLWRGSFRFAGRNLTVAFLRRNFSLIQEVFKDDPALARTFRPVAEMLEKLSPEDPRVTAAVEMVINQERFRTALRDARAGAAGATPAYARLEMLAEFALAGLYSYLGGLMADLASRRLFSASTDGLYICLGGRGSLLFKDMITERQRQRLAGLLAEAAGLKDPMVVKHRFGENLKEEVAYGLLVPPAEVQNLTEEGALTAAPLGELILVDGEPQPLNLSAAQLPADRKWEIGGFPALVGCVDLYARHLCRAATIEPRILNAITGPVSERLGELQRQKLRREQGEAIPMEEQVPDEPLFIVGLRALVEQMIVGELMFRPTD